MVARYKEIKVADAQVDKKSVVLTSRESSVLRDSITVRRAQLKRAIGKEFHPEIKKFMFEQDALLEELARKV